MFRIPKALKEINKIHPKIHLMTANNKFEVASEILA